MPINHIISPRLILKIVTENLVLRKLIGKDSLTGLPNRSGFNETAKSMFAQALRYQHPICIAMLDLDHFKKINDTYGHPVGDTVLKETAKILKNSLRNNDLIGRYGGEEFIVFLDLMPSQPGSKPTESKHTALIPLERMRKTLKDSLIPTPKGKIKVTISIGFSIFDPAREKLKNINKLIEEADKNLYQAKKSGRDCICGPNLL